MKIEDRYLKFVLWNEEDNLYVGYCPDLFFWGGVCHGKSEGQTYSHLCALVKEEIEERRNSGEKLPVPATRAMRDAVQV